MCPQQLSIHFCGRMKREILKVHKPIFLNVLSRQAACAQEDLPDPDIDFGPYRKL